MKNRLVLNIWSAFRNSRVIDSCEKHCFICCRPPVNMTLLILNV